MNSRITPKYITALNPNEVFVFGSNIEGRHGRGAARTALTHFGAKYGEGEGYFGQSYALPTRYFTKGKVYTVGTPFFDGECSLVTFTLSEISKYVNSFISFAAINRHLTFFVTEIGCNNAGYSPENIAPLFEKAKEIDNIYLPESFWKVLGEV